MTAERPIGVRERKKLSRRRDILCAARELFARTGYVATTIDSIAERAGISGVTVYNHFGTKSGVLLALVLTSEGPLLAELERRLDAAPDDTVEVVMVFARTVRRHAVRHLDRELWRQVLAAILFEGESSVGRTYMAFNDRLAASLVRRLERLRAVGAIPAEVDTDALGAALFGVQIVTFARFVVSGSMDEATVETLLRQRLDALLAPAS